MHTKKPARRYRIEKIYFLLTIFGGGVLLFPTFGMFLGIFTFGAAMLLPTLWLYATAALPAYAVRQIFGRTRLAAFIGIVSIAALAILPGQWANRELKRTLGDYIALDINLDVPQKPTSIQFVVDAGYDGSAPCDVICQRLLLTRSAQSITIRTNRRQEPSAVITYRLAQLSSCPDVFASRVPVLSSTREAIAGNRCIVPSVGDAMRDGVSIEERDIEHWSVPRVSLVGIYRVQQLRISKVEAGHETLLVKKTMVKAGKATTPFWLYVYWGFLTSVKGVAVAQVQDVYNQYRLLDALANVAGVDIDTRYCGDPRPYELTPQEILISQETSDSLCAAQSPKADMLNAETIFG
jgi:hypothetical protein